MREIRKLVALVGAIAAIGLSPAMGQVISFDEFGNGAFGPGTLIPDPGPGGLPSVMSYPLSFAGTQGDLFIHDADVAGNPFLDVVRWNGDGRLYFYSDNIDGADSPADTPSPPGGFYSNQVHVQEQGGEGGVEDVFYTPLPGQPGYDPANPNWTYHLISDGLVPEPGSATLLFAGIGLLASSRLRRKLVR